jgi:hypothetical protein
MFHSNLINQVKKIFHSNLINQVKKIFHSNLINQVKKIFHSNLIDAVLSTHLKNVLAEPDDFSPRSIKSGNRIRITHSYSMLETFSKEQFGICFN